MSDAEQVGGRRGGKWRHARAHIVRPATSASITVVWRLLLTEVDGVDVAMPRQQVCTFDEAYSNKAPAST
eukprot:355915-Chlamydomonas_euryale.AAC.11